LREKIQAGKFGIYRKEDQFNPIMDKNLTSAKALFENTVSSITVYERNEAAAIAFQLLEFFNISRTDILADKSIRFESSEKWNEMLERINNSEPLQYIIGETEFYGRKFQVNKNVLIPRPETEELVDIIIKENKHEKKLRILDIGTGTGCIPITLAKELPQSEVYAVDISEEALKIARQNAINNSATIDFWNFDIIKNLKFKIENFNILVSNPPYVTESEKKEMHSNVLNFEPHLALFVSDENPLLFYSKILDFAQMHLQPGGRCYLEINERFGTEMVQLMTSKKFIDCKIIKDLNGKNRFTSGKLPQKG
jgi:release factor glutamine methyltransferase